MTALAPDLRWPGALGTELLPLVRAAAANCTERFAAADLQAFVDGAAKLRHEGLGAAEIVGYLEHTPGILAHAPEVTLSAIVNAAIAIHLRGGAVATDRAFPALARAAEALRDTGVFADFLAVVQDMAATAPQSLVDLFARLPELLEKTSGAGLIRWARLGLQGHGRDKAAQRRYFSGDSTESSLILRLEGQGTLYTRVERHLAYYLRALWGRNVPTRAKSSLSRTERPRPFIDGGTVWLPDALPASAGGDAARTYRAAAAHAAAHLAYSRSRFKVGNYKPIKIVIVSMLEDARVEWLAARRLPGLATLWRGFHTASPALGPTFEALLARLARALIDPAYEDDNPWVRRGREAFGAAQARLEDQNVCIDLASSLANDIGQMRLQFNFKTYAVQPEYRDDHSFLWDWSDARELPPELEEDDEIVLEEMPTNPEEGERQETELREAQVEEADPDRRDEDSRQALALDVVLRTVDYAEWDYAIGRERPAWCTIYERQPPLGDAGVIEAILRRDQDLVGRVKRLIRSAQIQQLIRLRKQQEGDRVDIEQAIRAAIDLRNHRTPDGRIHMRTARRGRDLAVLVLLDLSRSTGDRMEGSGKPVIELEREAVALLAEAMHDLGDQFAIHGFTSNARRDVTYLRYKDFDQDYGVEAKSALAGAAPMLSTRMGAAIRHAGSFLRERAADRKLLLMITDGEPSDIDVHDTRYLTLDAKKAVESLAQSGMHTFCLSVDPRADKYVSRIFGQRNYLVVDRLAKLPEILPFVYFRLTHV